LHQAVAVAVAVPISIIASTLQVMAALIMQRLEPQGAGDFSELAELAVVAVPLMELFPRLEEQVETELVWELVAVAVAVLLIFHLTQQLLHQEQAEAVQLVPSTFTIKKDF
jgi:hypothetical protein